MSPPKFAQIMPTKLFKGLLNMNALFQVFLILWDVKFKSKKPAFTVERKYDILDNTYLSQKRPIK